jgi:hypothetical protein
MPAAEVATLNTDVFDESDGALIHARGISGAAENVFNPSNRLIVFAVGSTRYNVKLEDLDFDQGLVGVLRVFHLAQIIVINASDYVVSVMYEGLLTIDYTDESSSPIRMTVESDRISGRLLFSFEPTA